MILSCTGDRDFPQGQKNILVASETRRVPAFDYVAIEFSDFNDIYDQLKAFRQEMDSQRIIRTGPFFLMEFRQPPYLGNSPVKWAIGCATAEGQMVKKPLISGKWQSQFALVSRLQAPVEWLKDAKATWENISDASQIKADGIIVNRFLSASLNFRKGKLIPLEIWFPVLPPVSPPVTVSSVSQ